MDKLPLSLLEHVCKHNRYVAIVGHLEDTIYVNSPETIEFITEGNQTMLGDQYHKDDLLAIIDYRTGYVVTGDTVEQLCAAVGLKYNY